jgi:hypothetical protein
LAFSNIDKETRKDERLAFLKKTAQRRLEVLTLAEFLV